MNVTVEYTAQLRRQAGTASDQCALADGASLDDLAAAIANQRPAIASAVVSDGRLAGDLQVFVGGKQAPRDTTLSDGDRVLLLSPISGG